MSAVKDLLRVEENGHLSFGDHTLSDKSKRDDFPHEGDIYKVKTFSEITKLEKNGLFLYESVPGTSVNDFEESENGVKFIVEGPDDAQITLGLLEDTEYAVIVDGKDSGHMKTNLGGKLSVSVELNGRAVKVSVQKA